MMRCCLAHFAGGEASDRGLRIWSKALPDTHWDDGSEITKAYFCNCISCSVTNIVGNVGYPTKAEAIAAWNTRALPAVPTHRYAGESEASMYDRKGFPPIGLQGHAHAPVADSQPTIDPAAIREAALREAADVLPYASVYRAIILALIGEKK